MVIEFQIHYIIIPYLLQVSTNISRTAAQRDGTVDLLLPLLAATAGRDAHRAHAWQ